MRKYILLFLFSSNALASGLFHLTEFPKEKFYSEIGFGIKYLELSSLKELGSISYDQEPAAKALLKGGYLFREKHLFTVEVDYMMTETASDTRKGEDSIYFDYNNGFQEPYFEYRYRHRAPSLTENLLDFFVGIRPAVMDRKVGKNGLNTWVGRTVMNVGLYHGAQIPGSKWELQTLIQGTRYFTGKEEDVRNNITRRFDPAHEFSARFSAGYFFLPQWMVYGGIGLTIFGDNNLTSKGEDILLQRGTASNINLGVKVLMKEYVFDLSVTRTRHDYFLKADSYSFDGDIESWNIVFLSKREF